VSRGRYFTIPQAAEAYPGIFTERLLRRLIAERRIAFTRAGQRIVLADADLEAFLDAGRREPMRPVSPRRDGGAPHHKGAPGRTFTIAAASPRGGRRGAS